jgi:hypothetical protein
MSCLVRLEARPLPGVVANIPSMVRCAMASTLSWGINVSQFCTAQGLLPDIL